MTKDAAPFHPVYFTDSSKAKNGFTGSVVVELGHSIAPIDFSFRGGHKATAYDAEMIALSSAASKAWDWVLEVVSLSPHRREIGIIAEEPVQISFFSDCTSTLKNITDPGPHLGQAHSLHFLFYLKLIFTVTTNTTIHLVWALGHSGVIGNIRVDKIAKEAATGIRWKHKELLIAYLKMCSAKQVDKWWSAMHLDCLKGNQFISRYGQKCTPSNVFRNMDREPFGCIIQMLTGHGYFREYYVDKGIDHPPWCLCSADLRAPVYHTRLHVLQHCRRHAPYHNILITDIPQLMEVDWGPEQLGTPNAVLQAFVNFLKQSGAFTKLDVPFKLNLLLPPQPPPTA